MFCECGCGQPAPIAPKTDAAKGWVRGEPVRFCKGHHRRKPVSYYLGLIVPAANGCWPWPLSCDSDGYGLVSVRGRLRKAHRVVYEHLVGPIPGWPDPRSHLPPEGLREPGPR